MRARDGVSLSYCVSRQPGHSECVVVVNPPDQAPRWWLAVADGLRHHVDVVIPEYRGFPACERVLCDAECAFEVQVRDLDCILDAEDYLRRAHVVGWCAGAKLMLQLAESRGDRVRSLFGTGIGVGPSHDDERHALYATVRRKPGLLRLLVSRARADRRGDDGLLDYYGTETGYLNVLKLVEAFREVDKTHTLARTRLPCTLVHGCRDRVVRLPEAVLTAARENPEVRLHWVDGDHYLPASHPDRLRALILETVRRSGGAVAAAGERREGRER